MNFYGHGTYNSNNNNTPVPAPTKTNTHDHDHSPPRRRFYDAAMHALEQPHPPSLREVLGAYRMKGEGDREMLLAILQAKTAEDQRIAATTKLHQTLLQINFVPSDDFTTPGGAPLSPLPPPPPHYPPHYHRERPSVHPKFNDAPSSAVRRPSSSAASPYNHHSPVQARPTPTPTPIPRHSPDERRHSNSNSNSNSNGNGNGNAWTTAILSPSSGAESVDEDVTYRGTPSSSVKGNVHVHHAHHSPAGLGPPPPPETETEPRGTAGDRVMSIGTLLSSSSHDTSYERRRGGAHGMDVDEEEQARRGRRYD